MRHCVVTARLKPGAAAKAHELLRESLAPDLQATRLERHMVFVSQEELVLVFEGEDAEEEARRLLERTDGGTDRLAELIEGEPLIPREVFSWERPDQLEGIAFGPDPGPGDSDGGERD